jgi:class 3 adenylate cyclase/predicted ATPase
LEEPGGQRRCDSCGELNPARAKFCLGCGTPLALDLVDQLPQENGTAGERRLVTVLFADLSGFTAYSEGSDVEDVRAIAQETADSLGDIVERYGGTVDKIIGDCVMAVFGAPVAHEDDAERAVRTGLDMQEFVKENQDRFAGLKLSVGINTGEAMYSPIGPDASYTVLGDTVNTAARLQGAAAKGEVVIGAPTHEALGDAIECEEMEPIRAKNKAEPVLAWRAVSVKGQRTRHKPVRASLVGRDDELKRLRELWELVRRHRRPYGAILLGTPGIGKSRLIDAVIAEIGDDALVLKGRCLPYGEGITYWPIIEIIQQVAGIHHDDDPETVSQKLGDLLYSLEMDDLDELRTIAVAIANLIGAPKTPRGTYTAEKISRGELHWGLRRILERGSRNLPLVLVIEDLHWAEPALLELIDYVFSDTTESTILGIASGRPELKETGAEILSPRPNRRVFELEALSDDAARRVVAELFGSDDLPEDHVAELLHSAGGNPLFLEEMVQMWRESSEGSDDPLEALKALAVPNGIQALIGSRLDHLPARERRLLAHAAVIGDVFWSGALTSLTGGNGETASSLDSLESRDLIRSRPSSTVGDENEYAFKHGLIRDVAYGRLTKTERAGLHEKCGEWISALPGGEQEFAEIVAYHLEQACLLARDVTLGSGAAPILKAVEALRRAGEKAEGHEGMREAARFFARAVELLGDDMPETSVELRLLRSRRLVGLGELQLAYDEMEKAEALAAKLQRRDLRAQALISLAEVDLAMGHATKARAHIEVAREITRSLADSHLRVRTSFVRAIMLEHFEASPDGAVDELRAAVALAEELGDAEMLLNAHMRLGVLFVNIGRLEDARTELERSIELAREQGSLRHQSWLTMQLGVLRFNCGPRDEAHELFSHAATWLERINDHYMRTQTLAWLAALELRRDDLTAALKILREALPVARELRGTIIAEINAYLAEVLAVQGRSGEAREVAEEARELAPEEDPAAQANVLIAEAFAEAARGDELAARRSAAEAVEIISGQADPIVLGEILLAYGRLCRLLGDRGGAIRQLRSARDVFEPIGALATVAEIDGDLKLLGDRPVEELPA